MLLKSIGVMPTIENLCKALKNTPLAHWLLDEVDWKRRVDEVLASAFGYNYYETKVERSVAKRLLQEADAKTTTTAWESLASEYVQYGDVDVKIVKWLLQKSNVTSFEQEFALHCTDINEGKPKLLRFLVEKNFIEVNKVDSDSGKTLLHFAVEKNQMEMVKALVDLGADPTIQGKRGAVSPMAIARQRGQGDLVEILKAASAKQKNGGKGKRKRNDKKQEEKNAAVEREGNGEEQGGAKKRKVAKRKRKEDEAKTAIKGGTPEGEDPGKKRRKVAQSTKKPLSEEKKEEKNLEVQIGEQLKWICEQDASAKSTLKEVIDAQVKGFTVFPLKVICRKWKLSSPSQKRIDLLRVVSVFLEGQQAVVQAEL